MEAIHVFGVSTGTLPYALTLTSNIDTHGMPERGMLNLGGVVEVVVDFHVGDYNYTMPVPRPLPRV